MEVAVFDSHAHIDDERFTDDRDEVIARAFASGLTGIINVGADMKSSIRSIHLANTHSAIYASVGIHPHDAKNATEQNYEQLLSWGKDEKKVVAIGEIGLDYYYDLSPRNIQQEVFIRQLDIAKRLGKPIIIHDRDAHGDLLNIIKDNAKGLTGVFHCFSGSREMAEEVLRLGFYISFAGPLTFTKSLKLRSIASIVPLERILVETDSPYLTPIPNRGKRNEPMYVNLVADELAKLRNMTYAEIATVTTANVCRLFNITA